MQPSYEALVIGTGFGGAVAACRLSQAGQKVAVLERGRRYPLGGFPRNWHDPLDGWLWNERQGLFDVKPFEQMMVVQGAGYGGGSLIYANVHLRPTPSVFESGWPAIYSRAMLDPYYDLAAYMLEIKPITAGERGAPPKAKAMLRAAERLGRSAQFCYPNIAVDLGDPDQSHPNRFGIEQFGCRYCGECDIGCNYHAKNTLDLNYLALAERHGADVTVQCEAIRIEPSADGYRVTFINHGEGGRRGQTEAARVFVCCGAVNTTELLLRCRDEYKTLPKLSDWLGRNYSGNGDFLAFAFDTADPIKPSEGPTITTGTVFDSPHNGVRTWFILEEGGYPKEVAGIVQLLNPKTELLKSEAISTFRALRSKLLDAARGQSGNGGSDNTMVFLAMGRDTASGVIELHPLTHTLKIRWDTEANLPLYNMECRFIADVAKALGGKPVENPFWHMLHVPITVHNLGGCVMADSREGGVTDANGEVYGYPGLYVLDGSLLPAATGVNPSHTITAVAERNIEAVIRKLKGDPSWQAPERAQARPIEDPVSKIMIPASGTALPQTPAIGIKFTETMKGFVAQGWRPPDDYAGAERKGKEAGTLMNFTLTIAADDLDRFLADNNRTAVANGIVHVDPLTGPDGGAVANGVFNLFVQGDEFFQRKMLYALPFTGIDGRPYLLDGFKDVRDHGHFDVWGATSTLYTVIREGHEHDGPVIATGIVHILMHDFLRQLTTFQVTGTNSALQKAEALERFGKAFFGTLWDVFVRPYFQER